MRAVTLCWLLMASANARADDSWRCGDRIVTVGESWTEVLEKCGQPTSVKRRWESSRPRGRPLRRPVDDWTYDRGPNEFVRILTFADGILRSVETGDYGR
jgi:hypothetical protein